MPCASKVCGIGSVRGAFRIVGGSGAHCTPTKWNCTRSRVDGERGAALRCESMGQFTALSATVRDTANDSIGAQPHEKPYPCCMMKDQLAWIGGVEPRELLHVWP